jgi:site-specific recombinase XerD
MRHAFASRMISRGITSTVLAALIGHGSSMITERHYIHLLTGSALTMLYGKRWRVSSAQRKARL